MEFELRGKNFQLTIGSYLTLPTLDPINKSNFDVFLPKIASSPTSHRCSLNPELRNTTVLLLPSIFLHLSRKPAPRLLSPPSSVPVYSPPFRSSTATVNLDFSRNTM
jgi:hypothetical protein